MSKLLFKLRNVPDDEVAEVMALLAENDIDCYQTGGGNWGISMPALWIKHDHQIVIAQEIFDTYQEERQVRARHEYESDRQLGNKKTLWTNFLDDPIRVTAYMVLIGLVFYLSLKFFIGL